jgi:prevent-host-death family protein
MHIQTTSRTLRENWGAYIDHIAATGDRVLVTRHGREQIALVPVADLRALEDAEQREFFGTGTGTGA